MTRRPLVHRPGADNLPPGLTPEERAAAAHPGLSLAALEKLMSETTPATSPTGTPIVDPTSNVVRIVVGLVFALASAVALKQPDLFPASELDQQVAVLVVSMLGILSPGLRK